MSWLTVDRRRASGLGSPDPCADLQSLLAQRLNSMNAAYAKNDITAATNEQYVVRELQFRVAECKQRAAAGQAPSPYVAPTPAEVAASDATYVQRDAEMAAWAERERERLHQEGLRKSALYQQMEVERQREAQRREMARRGVSIKGEDQPSRKITLTAERRSSSSNAVPTSSIVQPQSVEVPSSSFTYQSGGMYTALATAPRQSALGPLSFQMPTINVPTPWGSRSMNAGAAVAGGGALLLLGLLGYYALRSE